MVEQLFRVVRTDLCWYRMAARSKLCLKVFRSCSVGTVFHHPFYFGNVTTGVACTSIINDGGYHRRTVPLNAHNTRDFWSVSRGVAVVCRSFYCISNIDLVRAPSSPLTLQAGDWPSPGLWHNAPVKASRTPKDIPL